VQVILLGHVNPDESSLRPAPATHGLGQEVLAACHVEIPDDHRGTLGQKALGGRPSDPTRPAGYDSHPAP
jgi:hypothetical protein